MRRAKRRVTVEEATRWVAVDAGATSKSGFIKIKVYLKQGVLCFFAVLFKTDNVEKKTEPSVGRFLYM